MKLQFPEILPKWAPLSHDNSLELKDIEAILEASKLLRQNKNFKARPPSLLDLMVISVQGLHLLPSRFLFNHHAIKSIRNTNR